MFEDGELSRADAGPAPASSVGGDHPRPTHPVLTAPLAAQACLSAGMASPGWSLSLAEVQGALAEVETAANLLEAYRLHLIPMLLTRQSSRNPGAATVAWMSDHLRIGRGQARADLDAARAVQPDTGVLTTMGLALAEGAIRREHVDIAVRALGELPTAMVRARGADIDALLTDQARCYAPTDAKKVAAHLIATLAPDGVEEYDDEAYDRRGLDVRTDTSGMVRLEGALDPVGGAVVKTVLDHLADPARLAAAADGSESGAEATASDDPAERSPRQRQADALIEMARLAQSALAGDAAEAEPARIVVHCTPEQLSHPDPFDAGAHCEPATDQGTGEASESAADHVDDASGAFEGSDEASESDEELPEAGEAGEPPVTCLAPGAAHCEGLGAVSPRTLHTLACDAVMERVVIDRHGKVLRLESLGRLANRAQRRALAARDGGCVWPGCSAPPSWCDAHHIVWWSRGGQTTLINLCLLCQHHHTQIHREQWQITVRNGVPWFIPPSWIDPAQAPRRNSIHADIARTRQIGQRLLTGQPVDDLAPPRPGHRSDRAA